MIRPNFFSKETPRDVSFSEYWGKLNAAKEAQGARETQSGSAVPSDTGDTSLGESLGNIGRNDKPISEIENEYNDLLAKMEPVTDRDVEPSQADIKQKVSENLRKQKELINTIKNETDPVKINKMLEQIHEMNDSIADNKSIDSESRKENDKLFLETQIKEYELYPKHFTEGTLENLTKLAEQYGIEFNPQTPEPVKAEPKANVEETSDVAEPQKPAETQPLEPKITQPDETVKDSAEPQNTEKSSPTEPAKQTDKTKQAQTAYDKTYNKYFKKYKDKGWTDKKADEFAKTLADKARDAVLAGKVDENGNGKWGTSF